jgi:4-amino-4-deoxy-L-arabinose transferase-like glycosyltransferase
VVLVAAIVALRGPSVDQGFTVDESRWIATSRYFWITFVDRDLQGPAWQPNYLVFTHPPVARYLIGFGLWLQGWSPDQLNGRYDSLQGRAFNERAGNVPGADLLGAARRVTFVFAVASVGLVYVVGRMLGGIVAGLAATGLVLVNPLLTTVWTRALAESIVAAFGLLALALALHVLPRVGTRLTRPGLPLVLGAALALAAATKLNGALGAVGLSLFALVQQSLSLVRTRWTVGFRSWVDVVLAAVIVFVAVNPLLYVDPAERIVRLVQHRQDEMRFQRSVFTSQTVPDDLASRIDRVTQRTFDTYASPGGPLPVSPDALLVPAGLLVVAWRTVQELRARTAGPSLLYLCWLGATFAVITVNLGFDSSHYYAPLVTLNLLCAGVAVAALVDAVSRLIRRQSTRHRITPDQNVQVPSR